jgi:Flp pilus assembly protein TadG
MIRTKYLQLQVQRFVRDEDGTTLVELAFVLPVFLLLFLGLIDFGRMGGEYVMAEKAMQLGTRIAAVRPAACPNVPQMNTRGTGLIAGVAPHYGAACSAATGICANPGTQTCTGVSTNATAAEIWTQIRPLMPSHATIANLRFSYSNDQKLGFLGGPYVPMVTLEIQNLNFQFATPLSALAALAAPGSTGPGASLPFPSMSMSMPAEDLALGNNG